MPAVASSAIDRVDYLDEEKVLMVTFNSGAVYGFSDIKASLYNDFLASESKGTFFAHHIRNLPNWRMSTDERDMSIQQEGAIPLRFMTSYFNQDLPTVWF